MECKSREAKRAGCGRSTEKKVTKMIAHRKQIYNKSKRILDTSEK